MNQRYKFLRLSCLVWLIYTAVYTTTRAQVAAEPNAKTEPSASGEKLTNTEITSRSVEMWSTDTETRSVFQDNVVVTGTNLKLTCDRLEVLATRLGDKTATVGKFDKFKSLIATGNVRIVQGDREVTCGRAEVYPAEDRVVLTEKPVVIDNSGPYQATGDRIVLMRGERRLFGDNIRMTAPAIKDLGFDKNKPMAAPAKVPPPLSTEEEIPRETPEALRRVPTPAP